MRRQHPDQPIKTLTDVSAGSFQGTGAGSHELLRWKHTGLACGETARVCLTREDGQISHRFPKTTSLQSATILSCWSADVSVTKAALQRILCEIHHHDNS